MEAAHNQSFIQNRPFVSLFIAASSITLLIVGILSQFIVMKGLSSHIGYTFLGVGCCGVIALVALAIKSCQEKKLVTNAVPELPKEQPELPVTQAVSDLPKKQSTLPQQPQFKTMVGGSVGGPLWPGDKAVIQKYDPRVTKVDMDVANTSVWLGYVINDGEWQRIKVENFCVQEKWFDIPLVIYILGADHVKMGLLDMQKIPLVTRGINEMLRQNEYYQKSHPNFKELFDRFDPDRLEVEFFIKGKDKTEQRILAPTSIRGLTATSLAALLLRELFKE